MPPSTEERLLETLLAAIERELPRAVELRRRLHATPELAHAEQSTARAIAAELPVAATRAAGTGLIAQVGAGATPAVGVRAELDGLPVTERTSAAYAARGETMHACGHDVHMAALVALARAAGTVGKELPRPLLALFQPSEEAYPSGAEQLARGPLAERPPAAVVAAHIHPELPWGALALDAGAVNASCDGIEVRVEGHSSHGAYPHRGRDPILALASIVVALHAQLGRRADPLGPAVLTIGTLEAGEADNVIPAHARAGGLLRAQRPADRASLREMVREVAEGVAAAHGCRAEVELTEGEPALENDGGIVSAALPLLPAAGLRRAPEWRSCGCDDFSFFGALAPIALAFVGLDGAEGFQVRPLHHPELLPPDDSVGAVARAQAVLYVGAVAALERAARSRG